MKNSTPSQHSRFKQVVVGVIISSLLISQSLAYTTPIISNQIPTSNSIDSDSLSAIFQPSTTLFNGFRHSPVSMEVKLPNSEYSESQVDLRTKVLGGEVKLTRSWVNGRWYLNPAWANLRFIADPLDNSIKTVDRVGTLFERTGDTNLYQAGNVYLRKTDNGWRWYNQNGDWISYDLAGRMTGYGNANQVKVDFILDEAGRRIAINDHHGQTLYRFNYDQQERLIKVEDQLGNSVNYHWQDQRLIKVIDVLGHEWQYAYNSDGQLIERREPDQGKIKIAYSYSLPAPSTAMTSGKESGHIETSAIQTSGLTPTDNKIARVASITDKTDAVTLYQTDYDRNKRQYTITVDEPSGKNSIKQFDHNGKLLWHKINGALQREIDHNGAESKQITDARGQVTTLYYNSQNQPLKIINPDGSSELYRYDNRLNKLADYTNALGITSSWQYDNKGNVTQFVQAQALPEAQKLTLDYDQYGQAVKLSLSSAAQSQGQPLSLSLDYDQQGNISKLVYDQTTQLTLNYNIRGQVTQLTDAAGHQWQYHYNAAGYLTQVTSPLKQSTLYESDALGRITKITDSQGNQSHYSYSYDTQGWQVTYRTPLGTTTQHYDPFGQLIKQVAANGDTLKLSYDEQGRLIQEQDPAGNITTYRYGAALSPSAGLLIETQYPTYKEHYRYNSNGQIIETQTETEDGTRLTTQRSYDALGRLITTRDAAGKITQLAYDALDRLISVSDPLGNKTRFERDWLGNVAVVINAKQQSHRFEYDPLGNLTKEISPLGMSTEYRYNINNQLISKIDAKGNQTDYQYNADRNLTQITFSQSGQSVPQQLINYHYNKHNQLTEISQQGNLSVRLQYEYNPQGLRSKETITYGSADDAISHSLEYGYDSEGRRISITYPDGSQQLSTYDHGQLKSVILPNGQTISWNGYQWQQPTQIITPVSETTLHYDGLQRQKQISIKSHNAPALLSQTRYHYDNAGNIIERKTHQGDYQYRYNRLNQLEQVIPPQALQEKGLLAVESYAYDALGNRLGSSQQPGEWHYNADNQLLEFGADQQLVRYQYSKTGQITSQTQGNQTLNYGYDARDRLITIHQNEQLLAAYSYDPLGRRSSKTVNGRTTWYLYSDEGLLAELDENGSILTAYGWQPDSLWGTQPLWQAEVNGSSLNRAQYHFLHTDHLGTPQLAVNQQQQVSWQAVSEAFGKTLPDADNQITMNLRLPGQYFDQESGTHYNFFRDYHPQIGRYIQSDPIGLMGGMNLYGYANNDPLIYIDPTGEFGLAGAVYGALSGAVGGYITGGWEGAAQGAMLGAVLGFVLPPGAASAALTSAAGQAAGLWMEGEDLTDPCNYDYGAMIGSGIGAKFAKPAVGLIKKYAPIVRPNIIGRPIKSRGINKMPGDVAGAITEGAVIGAGESTGSQLGKKIK